MADFHQNGVIATLHKLSERPLEQLESDLVGFSKARPMTLVLPSLYSELEGPALRHIVKEIAKVPYLDSIVIGLDRANKKQFEYAKEFFSVLPQKHRILWNDGPNLKAVQKKLEDSNLGPEHPGKGCNVWYCFGYAQHALSSKVIGLHDCDILTYDRSMLARLLYPVANPNFNYVFAKGYYPRVAEGKMNGRVTRLLVTPLIHALRTVCGFDPYLNYLNGFRYPLAGEFAMHVDVIADLRMPSDWGLEIGILSEIRKNYSTRAICQVDISDAYDHKHQPVSEEDKTAGLSKMSIDITTSIFRKLAISGHIFSRAKIRTIKATYFRQALDLVEMYRNDAAMNGLGYDVHQEEKTVELFAENILVAGENFLDNMEERPFIPRWNRVSYALPEILKEMSEAVEADNA